MRINANKILSIFLLGLAAYLLPVNGWYYLISIALTYKAFTIWGD